MNWYKQSKTSFIDQVMCIASTDSYLVLLINGKRYKYEGLSGKHYCSIIDNLKKKKNKMEAGQKAHNIIKNIEPFRIRETLDHE